MKRMVLNSRELVGDRVRCKRCEQPASVVFKVVCIEDGCNDRIEYVPLCDKHRKD